MVELTGSSITKRQGELLDSATTFQNTFERYFDPALVPTVAGPFALTCGTSAFPVFDRSSQPASNKQQVSTSAPTAPTKSLFDIDISFSSARVTRWHGGL